MTATIFDQHAGVPEIDGLLSGFKWGGALGQGATVTYSFPAAGAYWAPGHLDYPAGSEPYKGFIAFGETQKAAIRAALAGWEEVANITFVEVLEAGQTVGDMRFGFSSRVGELNASAYASFPGASPRAGDVWFDPSLLDLANPYYTFTVVHEIGHALGFKHAFEAAFGFPALPPEQANPYYTTVSYFSDAQPELAYPVGPMAYDILAMQYVYGVKPGPIRAADNAFEIKIAYGSYPGAYSAVDTGGIDEIRVQQVDGYYSQAFIDLNEGHWSGLQATSGDPIRNIHMIYVAPGSVIENAKGWGGSDRLTGNGLDNILEGGKLNDTIEGGGGVDTAVFQGATSAYTVSASAASVGVTGPDGVDTLTGVERLRFDDTSLALDIQGNAGEGARMLAAVFGASALTAPWAVGIAVNLSDRFTFEEMMGLALDYRFGLNPGNRQFVDVLYSNIAGELPDAGTGEALAALLDSHHYTQLEFAVLAAQSTYNFANVTAALTTGSGLVFVPME